MPKTWKMTWVAAVAALVGLGIAALPHDAAVAQLFSPSAQIGGPFELTDQDGKKLTSASLRGMPFAVFFGFTSCPDICPTTMLELANVLKRLGSDADRMRYFFISVDTERDTPEHLKQYLSSFDTRIMGLTGSAAEIAAVAKAYRAYYEKVSTKDGYTYNHTALIYLMGRDGHLVSTITYQESEDTQVKKIRKLIAMP